MGCQDAVYEFACKGVGLVWKTGQQVGDDLLDGESKLVCAEDVVTFERLCEDFLGVEQLYVAVVLSEPQPNPVNSIMFC